MHRYARIHAQQFDPVADAGAPAETNAAASDRTIASLRSAIAWHLWLARGARRSAARMDRRVDDGGSMHPETARRLAQAYRADADKDDQRVRQLRTVLAARLRASATDASDPANPQAPST